MKKILLPLLAIVLIFSCQKQISTEKVQEEIASVAANKQAKVIVCHYDVVTNTWNIMNVPLNALTGHLAHGDVQLADADGDGFVEAVNQSNV